MIEEQRLQARLAALDAAVRMVTSGGRSLVNNDEMITDTAEHFEKWLMRPSPADVDAAHRRAAGQHPRCDVVWRNDDGIGHMCGWLPGHVDHVGHLCSCGDRLGMTS